MGDEDKGEKTGWRLKIPFLTRSGREDKEEPAPPPREEAKPARPAFLTRSPTPPDMVAGEVGTVSEAATMVLSAAPAPAAAAAPRQNIAPATPAPPPPGPGPATPPASAPPSMAPAQGASMAGVAASQSPSRLSQVTSFDGAGAPGSQPASTQAWDLRYPLGSGGMADVFRVRDPDLNRAMALKVIHSNLMAHNETFSRFVEEAQITAQLEHPAIIPIHSMGRLDDGRVYFTMKEVKGRTFFKVIREVHVAKKHGQWYPGETGWTFHKLIDAFLRVCEAVAYAHAHNVIHRDLKPANIMVGEFGEVLVMDWGLAKVVGTPEQRVDRKDLSPIVATPWRDDGHQTLYGSIAGTPAYMAPEQARGEVDVMGPPTDVYALGSILYQILAGRVPIHHKDQMLLVQMVVESPPAPFDALTTAMTPEPLRDLAMRALSKKMQDRPADAGVLAREISEFLDGAKRKEQARKMVMRADGMRPRIDQMREQAGALRAEARGHLATVAAYEPASRKAPAWDLEEKATRIERSIAREEVAYLQELRGALSLSDDLPEAHERLADLYMRQHKESEARGDENGAVQFEALVEAHDRDGRYKPYLDGAGLVSLETDPPRAEVTISRYTERGRRLELEPTEFGSMTPLNGLALPRGSYRLELRFPGRAVAHYPISVGRMEHWRANRPGDARPQALKLPGLQALETDEALVPAGWFWAGGDTRTPSSLVRQRVWVDGFIMKKAPVTNRDYLKFLNDMVKMGRFPEAMRHVPRRRGATPGDAKAFLFGMRSGEGFTLEEGADPTLAAPDAPVTGVSWLDGLAYASWYAGQTGKPWRLPGELEWEKAARGVDGRAFPWGDHGDPSWACCYDSHEGEARPASVRAFAEDQSPYGVRGLGGNMATWCMDRYHPDGPALVGGRYQLPGLFDDTGASRQMGDARTQAKESKERVIRGGAWSASVERMRSAHRDRALPDSQSDQVGIRLVADASY